MRRVFTRLLGETMQTGDYYITLSNIDFWALTPKENLTTFIQENINAIKLGKSIHRIVVLEKINTSQVTIMI
ncbi:MAG: hypothetical protein HWD58_18785 [Bacteroidota bacterium]|nr:MAG: hypothetical protein HWD58_18785 [Bacteroidota bacterium]